MSYRYDSVRRLEPAEPIADLSRGFEAEVADPLWMLGRQWQLGEHQGEDASSPVRVECTASLHPIDPLNGDPALDPRIVPGEAVIESEPEEWWTPGRRVAVGRRVERAAAAAGRPLPDIPALRLADLPVPYDLLNGTGFDGRALYRGRQIYGLDTSWFDETPPQPADLWDSADFTYNVDFTAGGTVLRLRRHDGGELDWFSVDAEGPTTDPSEPLRVAVYPSRVRYPGSPHPRWWEIEDAQVDIGGYAPDRSHFPTLLLILLVTSHSDSWFTFPITARSGHVVRLDTVTVQDSFGDRWTVDPPDDAWSLFAVAGLEPTSLLLWPSVTTPLAGPALDEVDIGIDEDANILWAVERRIGGREVPTPERKEASPPEGEVDASAPPRYAYKPTKDVPLRWHPYRIEEVNGRRRFVQCRLADLSGPSPKITPEPASDLLFDPLSLDPARGRRHPVHQIEPSAIPTQGLRLERRYVLARGTDALPVLWTQRRRLPLRSPPGLQLRCDVLEQTPPS